MNQYYKDILERIDIPPVWFDEHAVPRFSEFSPAAIADIYADEAVLAEITCQNCRTRFNVALSNSRRGNFKVVDNAIQYGPTIADLIRNQTLHYGDPPNIQCCAAGPSMNSVPIRVIEYWFRHDPQWIKNGVLSDFRYFDWSRQNELEIALTDL